VPPDFDVSHLRHLVQLGLAGYGSHWLQHGAGTRLPARLDNVDIDDSEEVSIAHIIAGGNFSRFGNPVGELNVSAKRCIKLGLAVDVRPSGRGQRQADAQPAVPVGFRGVTLTARQLKLCIRQSGVPGRPCRSAITMLGRLLDWGLPKTCKRLSFVKRTEEAFTLIGSWYGRPGRGGLV
jgi:hypothetical protein